MQWKLGKERKLKGSTKFCRQFEGVESRSFPFLYDELVVKGRPSDRGLGRVCVRIVRVECGIMVHCRTGSPEGLGEGVNLNTVEGPPIL